MKEMNLPIMNHIPEDNFLFTVLGTENDSFYEAIMEHFFEISYCYKPWGNFVTFNYEEITNWNAFKGLQTIYLAQNYLDSICSFSKAEELVNHFLHHGYHLLVPVDQYYITPYHSEKMHCSRILYIVNAEENEEEFICQDFFNGYYKKMPVSKKEVLNAMCNYRDTYNRKWKGQDTGLVALKRKEGYVYEFRPRVFLNRFQNMLYSEYDFQSPSFGMGIFDAMIETHTNSVSFWRPSITRKWYQFINDNVELIKYRLSYLCKINKTFDIRDFGNRCEAIQNYCITERNSLLKYEIQHKCKLIVKKGEDVKRMADSLKFLKEEFCKLLEDILCEVKRSFFSV